MARIRTVKPDLFGSYTVAEAPIEARFLFVGLFCEADDEGRLIDSPKRLAGAIFPHDEGVTTALVDRWLECLAEVGCILRYTAGGGRYICIPRFKSHQTISHPSKSRIPAPSGVSLEDSRGCPDGLQSSSALKGKGKGNYSLNGSADPLEVRVLTERLSGIGADDPDVVRSVAAQLLPNDPGRQELAIAALAKEAESA